MSDGEDAGALLRLLRLYARLSLEEVAAEAQTSVDYLLAVEEGSVPAPRPFIRHIADVIAGRLVAAGPLTHPSRSSHGLPPLEERAEPA